MSAIQQALKDYGEEEVIREAISSLERRAELRGETRERERCAGIVLAHPAAEPHELAELIRSGS